MDLGLTYFLEMRLIRNSYCFLSSVRLPLNYVDIRVKEIECSD